VKVLKYTANKESISTHEVPQWYHDAKLGIFIHWGLFSVPAFAHVGLQYPKAITKVGFEEYLKKNPYAEWYLNTLRISDSPTQEYHYKTYGENFPYHDFAPMFNEAIKKWKPEEWADLFKKIGAKYVVLVTKHCDGFLLWPSKHPNPNEDDYIASRDIVGELTEEVKKRSMKMGFYYSTAWDWSFNLNPIVDGMSFIENYINPEPYTEYVNTHIYELIDNYEPLLLWADMGYPPGTNIFEIFAYFYNKNNEGVVNDRWRQVIPKEKKLAKLAHCDYTTPEYTTPKKIKKKKWEATRGLGNSFGYNKFETIKDYMTLKELLYMFIDIVSKNGNLLLNVGPMVDGTIPEIQKERLLGLGKWLDVNGEAIFGTRPWKRAEGTTRESIPVRFTQKNEFLYAILMGKPETETITLENLNLEGISEVDLLGNKENLSWKLEDTNLTINLPKKIEESLAIAFKIK